MYYIYCVCAARLRHSRAVPRLRLCRRALPRRLAPRAALGPELQADTPSHVHVCICVYTHALGTELQAGGSACTCMRIGMCTASELQAGGSACVHARVHARVHMIMCAPECPFHVYALVCMCVHVYACVRSPASASPRRRSLT